MKKLLLLYCLLFVTSYITSQSLVSLRGYIIDQSTNTPLSYVNIGFVNETVGTVSDDDGFFELVFKKEKISDNSTLQISSIGYKTLKFSFKDFVNYIKKQQKFFLEPDLLSLDEIVLTNIKRREDYVGILNLDEKTVGYWLNSEALGGELATLLPISHKKTKIHDLKFYITRNNSQNIKVRVNIYSFKNGYPEKNLLTKNIYYTIKGNSTGIVRVNLEPYNIIVNDDIIVSLELIKVGGRFIDFEIGGSKHRSHSFTREISLDKWKRHDHKGLAFRIRTSYPDKKGKVITESRITPNKITLYWDESKSTTTRNIPQELKLLSRYLKEIKNCTIEVIKFNTNVNQAVTFDIKNGQSKQLLNFLKDAVYIGDADYSSVLKSNPQESDVILLFSDGVSEISSLEQKVYVPTFAITSDAHANFSDLELASDYANGSLINLNALSINDGLKYLLFDKKNYDTYNSKDAALTHITGKVKTDTIPIAGATIRVKNSLTETTTNTNGIFTMKVKSSDVLQVEALGMNPTEVAVADRSSLEVNLVPNREVLDEIKLYAKIKAKSKIITTPYGKKNVDAVGYQVDQITNKQINSSHQTIDQLVAKLPGVIIQGVGDEKRYSFTRSMGGSAFLDTSPIIVIDGIIHYQQDGLDKLPAIDIQTIKSIKAFKSLASTNRYGSAGAYGVIEIQTEATAIPENKKEKKNSLINTNKYTEESLPTESSLTYASNSLKKLESTSSFYDAKEVYRTLIKSPNNNTISFYLATARYFKKWDLNFSKNIASGVLSIAPNNSKALRSLAYTLEKDQHYKLATKVYKKIKELSPHEAQSYIDLASAYELSNDYIKALHLYKQILSSSIENVNFTSIQQIAATNFKHFLTKHQKNLDFKGIHESFLNGKFDFHTRILFQWSHPNHEFEIQFVNPNKSYFNWTHTMSDNKEQLISETVNGFTTQEFAIDKKDTGKWIINIESLKDNYSKTNPPHLKYIRIENFGTTNEKKIVKVIPLTFPYKKVNLDSFIIRE